MDFEKLGAGIPGAQEKIAWQRAYKADLKALAEPVAELEVRIDRLLENLDALRAHQLSISNPNRVLQDNKGIVLRRVESSASLDSPTQPGGLVIVNLIQQFTTYYPTASPEDRNSYTLRFFFIADEDGKSENLGEESTTAEGMPDELQQDYSTTWLNGRHKIRAATHVLPPPPAKFNNESDPASLETYRESYLQKRIEQIEELEKSVAWIQKSLEDPQLNPWFAEAKAQLEAAAAAAANEGAEETEKDQPAEPQQVRRFRLRGLH